MLWLPLLAAVLAVWEIVEIWHHSALFAAWRARAELWEGFFGQLLRCPFCLSPWVSAVVCALLALSSELDTNGFRWAAMSTALPVYILAVARAANVASDLTRGVCRTPQEDPTPTTGETADAAGRSPDDEL